VAIFQKGHASVRHISHRTQGDHCNIAYVEQHTIVHKSLGKIYGRQKDAFSSAFANLSPIGTPNLIYVHNPVILLTPEEISQTDDRMPWVGKTNCV